MVPGADDDAGKEPDDGKKDAPQPDEQPKDDDLGDPGKRALAEERQARKVAERQAKAVAAELAKLKESTATDAEKAVLKAREEGKAEALEFATARLLKAEIKAAAAGRLADPNDAVRLLDSDEFTGEDGAVDEGRLKKALDTLLKDKPYLAGKHRANGDAGGGPRGQSTGPSMDDWLRSQARSGRR